MRFGATQQNGLRYKQRKPFWLLAVAVLVFAALACGMRIQSTGRLLPSFLATPTVTPTATVPPTHTPLPPSPTPTNTPTPLPPTATQIPTATLTPQPTASALQLSVLEEIWSTVKDNYLYEDFNGLDWEAVYQEYLEIVEQGIDDEQFYQTMGEMIAALGDEHSLYFSPADAALEDEDYSGELDYVGIGVITAPVVERQRVTIILVFPDSPAEQAGLRPHDNILAVDGKPILDENGDRLANLRGPQGTQVNLTIQTPGSPPRQVKLTRQSIDSGLPAPFEVLASEKGLRIGYLFLPTFNDRTIPRKVRRALQEMRSGGRMDGLILDNRHNEGGTDAIFEDILAYFEDGKLGHFVNRDQREALFVDGRDLEGTQQIPLVVLVGPGTASFGEIFSGILKDTQRAYLIGETTDGNVEILYVYNFSDGSRAWIAHDRFQPLNHPDQDWEKSGIIPNLSVAANWDEITQESDPVIQAALDYFDRR